jgi:hypothetical protein
MPIRTCLLALLLLMAAISVAAQQHDDVRLSTEPLQMILPTDAQIQSAARIGELTLVVWGTTRLEPDSSVVNMLVMQLLRDTTLIGPQRVLTSNAARPSGFVQVMAVRDRFVVAWNDRRGGDSAAYVQRVDTSGVLSGSEEQFFGGTISPFGIAQIGTQSGYLLVWNKQDTTSARIYSRAIDSVGNFVGSVSGPLQGTMQQIIQPSLIPGLTLLHRGDLHPLTVGVMGNIDTLRGEAARHFDMPYYLDDDGSMVTLDGDTLKFYRAFVDVVPDKAITIKLPERHPGSEALCRDSSGQIGIVFATGGSGSYYGNNLGGTRVQLIINRVRLDSNGILGQVSLVGTVQIDWLSDRHVVKSFTLLHVSRDRECSNGSRFYLSFDTHSWISRWEYGLPDIVEYYVTNVEYELSDHGSIVTSPSLLCRQSLSITVARVIDRHASRVALSGAFPAIELVAQSAVKPTNIRERGPAITLSPNHILVAWSAEGLDSTVNLAQCPPVAHSTSVTIDLEAPSHFRPSESTVFFSEGFDEFIGRNGRFFWNSIQHWKDSNCSTCEYQFEQRLFAPTDSGWRQMIFRRTRGTSETALKLYAIGSNPEDEDALFGIGYRYSNRDDYAVEITAVDSSMNQLWLLPNFVFRRYDYDLELVPNGPQDFLMLLGSQAIWYAGRDTLRQFLLPLIAFPPRYIRLLGPYVLRSYVNNNGMWWTNLEVFTIGGMLQAIREIHFSASPAGFYYVQNPTDSGFAVIAATNQGVRATFLDKRLNILQSDVRISATADSVRNPAAVFRNDTLFVVWEDYRNGNSDIYGNWLPVQTRSAVDEEFAEGRKSALQIVSIQPNPASRTATVELSHAASRPSSFEIIDSYGEVRMRLPVEAGSSSITLDVSPLPNGMYIASMRDSRHEAKRFVVIH